MTASRVSSASNFSVREHALRGVAATLVDDEAIIARCGAGFAIVSPSVVVAAQPLGRNSAPRRGGIASRTPRNSARHTSTGP